MFNYSSLQQFFLGKVGFYQTQNPCMPKVHPTLLSKTIAVNGVSDSLLTNETIYRCIDELTEAPEILSKVPLWSNATTYALGDTIKYTSGSDTYVYVSLIDGNINNTPAWNSSNWETNLSSYLRRQHAAGVSECLNVTFTENNNEKILPTVISYHTIFERYTQSQADAYLPTNFVGVQISLASLQNLQFSVNQIGLEVTDAQTIRFYVYAQSNKKYVTYFDIVIAPSDINNFVWKDVIDFATNEPLVLSYFADTSDVGGLYYIGFFRDEVAGNVSIWETAYLNFKCSNGSFVTPIVADFSDKPNLPNVGYYGWETSNNCYTPFNLKVSTSLDYTVNVKQFPQQFYKAIQYQIAINLLQNCRNSDRITRTLANLVEKTNKVLNGDEVVRNGFATTQNGLLYTLYELKKNLKINLNYLGGSPLSSNFG